MSARRTLKHCLTLMGTAMFLGVSLGFTAQAAPLCAGVFSQIMSEKEIDSKIQALARLRLSLDLELTSGNQSIASDLLKSDFSRMLAELSKALESRYTREELRTKISEEIHKLQNKSKEDTAKEKVVRAETRDLLTNYIFKKRIEIPKQITFNHVFEYIPELNAVIYQENNKFEIIKRDIDTGSEIVLAQGTASTHLMPDRKTLLVVSHKEKIKSVDIASGLATDLNDLPPGYRMYSKVDTSGEMLYVAGDGTLVAYNLKKQTSQTFPGVYNTYTAAAFGNKVILTGNDGPVIFDITTGTSQNIGPKHKIQSKFVFISDDNTQVVLETQQSKVLEFYDIDHPEKPVAIAETRKLAKFEFFNRHQKMPGVDLIVGLHATQENANGTWEIYALNNLNEPVFEFLGYEPQNGFIHRIEYLKWTPDRKKVALMIKKQDSRGESATNFIDIWELAE